METRELTTKLNGPWRVNNWETTSYVGRDIKDSNNDTICTMQHISSECQAKIMAASPELLQGNIIFLDYLEKNNKQDSIIYVIIKDIVDKATR